jgi:hypothetical protein
LTKLACMPVLGTKLKLASLSLCTGVTKDSLLDQLSLIHDTTLARVSDECTKHNEWMLHVCDSRITSSEKAKRIYESFDCSVSLGDLVDLSRELEELSSWKGQYFKQRDRCLEKLNQIIDHYLSMGNASHTRSNSRHGRIFFFCKRCFEFAR